MGSARLTNALTWLFSTLLVAAPMPAQVLQGSKSETTSSLKPLCIEILGASVSAGFVDSPMAGGSKDNASTPLVMPFRAWLDGSDVVVKSRADTLMFLDSRAKGRLQVERAAKAEPDLVVAVDFLFWFGYGSWALADEAGDEELQARLGELQLGLAMLDSLRCAIVLGDLPDMRGADRRMLKPSQIPSVDCLQALNREVHAWAKDRPRVRVFPLARHVAEMRDQGVRLPLPDGELATKPGALLQADRLHATRLGVAYLTYLLEPQVRAALPEVRRSALPAAKFDNFCAYAGAEDELAILQAGSETEQKQEAPVKDSGR